MTAHSAEPGKPAAPEKGEKGDKRERILDAAEQVFAAHGFFAAKVSEIAKEAGVADGTIYLYFKNKDDLLISLFESRMERVNAHLAHAIAHHKAPREKLVGFIRAYLALVKEQPAAAEVLTVELRQSAKLRIRVTEMRWAPAWPERPAGPAVAGTWPGLRPLGVAPR